VLVFGAYITDIQYGVPTGAVQATGHLQVFRNGYFRYGTAAPADWGIDRYQDVLRLIREDPELKQLTAVVTPIQSLSGIAGNFENNTSKPFFGTGFVPSDRDRMKQWNEYGTGSQGLTNSGLRDNDLTEGITGTGVVRILGLCDRLHLNDCPPAPKLAARQPDVSTNALATPTPDLAELAGGTSLQTTRTLKSRSSMPAASGWITSKLMSSLWIFRVISRRCLRFICCQWPCVGPQVASLGFLLLFVFHANRSTSNSTWLGPVSETYSISPAGSGPYPLQDNAATIYTIANYSVSRTITE